MIAPLDGAAGVGTALLGAALLLLRAAHRGRFGHKGRATLAGWALVAAGFAMWGLRDGVGRALALAALAFSLLGYAVVIASVQIRTRATRIPRQRHDGAQPLARPARAWRIGARIALAGPLCLLFGGALALILATRMPGPEVNSVVLAGLLAPVAFAGAMTWALAAQRLGRVLLGLGASSLLMTGLVVWKL